MGDAVSSHASARLAVTGRHSFARHRHTSAFAAPRRTINASGCSSSLRLALRPESRHRDASYLINEPIFRGLSGLRPVGFPVSPCSGAEAIQCGCATTCIDARVHANLRSRTCVTRPTPHFPRICSTSPSEDLFSLRTFFLVVKVTRQSPFAGGPYKTSQDIAQMRRNRCVCIAQYTNPVYCTCHARRAAFHPPRS